MSETMTKAEPVLSTAQKQRLAIAQSMGISEKCLPPITGKKIAIYRSTDAILDDKENRKSDGGTRDPLVLESQYSLIMPLPSTILEGTFSFLDPFNSNLYEATKMIKNISRTSMTPETDKSGNPTGKAVMKEEIEPVVFDGGMITVNIDTQFPLYVFLELHPLNQNGKFKRSTGPYAFYRHDLQLKGRGVQNVEMDLALDAEVAAKNLDYKTLVGYATSIPGGPINVMNAKPGDVKRDFRKWARENPREFFKMVRNIDATIRLTVAQAVDLAMLTLSNVDKTFYLEGDVFFPVDKAEEDPIAALLKFLGESKNADKLKKIEEVINYWD